MTEPTPTSHNTTPEDFRSSEGLRALLTRLHNSGPRAWSHDRVAADLMEYARDKYAPLAAKHGLDPWEAVSAAFDVMLTHSARTARDPWAVVTHAVRITCIFEERAQGLLCSVHQARRPHISALHDPERFSERDNPLLDYHPAFHTTDPDLDDDLIEDPGEESTTAHAAASAAIDFLTLLGWPVETARAGVEHICGALMRAGSRQAAFEALRRDKHARALLDIPARSWLTLLRTILGRPDPALSATSSGRGILLRLLIGETVPVLLHDDDLVLAVSLAAPHTGAGR